MTKNIRLLCGLQANEKNCKNKKRIRVHKQIEMKDIVNDKKKTLQLGNGNNN